MPAVKCGVRYLFGCLLPVAAVISISQRTQLHRIGAHADLSAWRNEETGEIGKSRFPRRQPERSRKCRIDIISHDQFYNAQCATPFHRSCGGMMALKTGRSQNANPLGSASSRRKRSGVRASSPVAASATRFAVFDAKPKALLQFPICNA